MTPKPSAKRFLILSKSCSLFILLGFKNVGKTAVGKALAEKLQRQFIDLDEQIEREYNPQSQQSLSCREIFNQHGERFFRDSETLVLKKVLEGSARVIALGGGTPLKKENQTLLQPHWLIHITAIPEVVYQRLIAQGIPAFFADKSNPLESFRAMWEQRQPVYASLANCTVDNSHTVDDTLRQIRL